jgi:hypothetical protein
MTEPEPEFQRLLAGGKTPLAIMRIYALWVRAGLMLLLWTSIGVVALALAALVGYAAWRMLALGLRALG